MASVTPSPSLLANLRADLMKHPPFAQMQRAEVDTLLSVARQTYYEPGEVVLTPAHGPAPAQFTALVPGVAAMAPGACGGGGCRWGRF